MPFIKILVVGGAAAASTGMFILFMLWRFVWTAGLPASSHAPAQ
jgi:hypothetical protein